MKEIVPRSNCPFQLMDIDDDSPVEMQINNKFPAHVRCEFYRQGMKRRRKEILPRNINKPISEQKID